jgi:hypothetical protein
MSAAVEAMQNQHVTGEFLWQSGAFPRPVKTKASWPARSGAGAALMEEKLHGRPNDSHI